MRQTGDLESAGVHRVPGGPAGGQIPGNRGGKATKGGSGGPLLAFARTGAPRRTAAEERSGRPAIRAEGRAILEGRGPPPGGHSLEWATGGRGGRNGCWRHRPGFCRQRRQYPGRMTPERRRSDFPLRSGGRTRRTYRPVPQGPTADDRLWRKYHRMWALPKGSELHCVESRPLRKRNWAVCPTPMRPERASASDLKLGGKQDGGRREAVCRARPTGKAATAPLAEPLLGVPKVGRLGQRETTSTRRDPTDRCSWAAGRTSRASPTSPGACAGSGRGCPAPMRPARPFDILDMGLLPLGGVAAGRRCWAVERRKAKFGLTEIVGLI